MGKANLQSPISSSFRPPISIQSRLWDYLGYHPLPVTRACLTIHLPPPPPLLSWHSTTGRHPRTLTLTHPHTHTRTHDASRPYLTRLTPSPSPNPSPTSPPTASYTHTHTPHSSGLKLTLLPAVFIVPTHLPPPLIRSFPHPPRWLYPGSNHRLPTSYWIKRAPRVHIRGFAAKEGPNQDPFPTTHQSRTSTRERERESTGGTYIHPAQAA